MQNFFTSSFIFLAGIGGLISDLYSLMEYILQMAESLTTGLRHNVTSNQTANSGHTHRIEPSKVADVTKMALRQLAIGIMIALILLRLSFKAQSTNAFSATIYHGDSSQLLTAVEHAVIKSLSTVQTRKQGLAVVGSW